MTGRVPMRMSLVSEKNWQDFKLGSTMTLEIIPFEVGKKYVELKIEVK